MLKILGIIGAFALPLCNIPLIIKIIRRKSSVDISVWWAIGVWGCLAVMLPSGLISPDPIYRLFTLSNMIIFSAVVAAILRYR